MSTLFNIGNKIATTTEALLPVQEATAGYSLRNIGIKGYNQPVVKVLRETDSAEEDFTASEVSDGTLVDWVNVTENIYTSDFSTDEDGWLAFKGTVSGNESVGGEDDAVKFTLNNENSTHFLYKTGFFELKHTYTVSFDVYIPSGQTVNGVRLTQWASGTITETDTTGEWVTLTETFTVADSSTADRPYFYATVNGNTTVNADGDVFYLKNIVFNKITSNGLVKVWYDQFGDNNATQNTVSEMPKIVSFGALVTENGKPALDFDGVDDELTDALNLSQPFTAFGLGTGTKNNNTYFDGSSPRSFLRSNDSTRASIFSDSILTSFVGTSADYKLIYGLFNGVNSEVSYNGQAITSGDAGTDGLGTISIGAGSSFATHQGTLQEIILYASDQSANRTKIEYNINNYYNIYS